jgi:hypothetical protein
MGDRSPEEIRASIEENRKALAVSLDKLRGEVAEITNWRKQLTVPRREAIIGAVIAGFLAGGGLTGFGRKRKRRR